MTHDKTKRLKYKYSNVVSYIQAFVDMEQTTRGGEAKRAIKQFDNTRLLLGVKSENEKANVPKQLTFF